MVEYNFHKIADIFPMMGDSELTNLVNDMRVNGFQERHPIILFEGKIVDGRNRYLAAKRAGVEPVFEEFRGTVSDAIRFVWQNNFLIRGLTSSQRAACIVAHEDIMAQTRADARERQNQADKLKRDKSGKFRSKPVSQIFDELGNVAPTKRVDENTIETRITDEKLERAADLNRRRSDAILAKTANTNRQYVSDAKKIHHKSPEVFNEVRSGRITIPEANKITKLATDVQKTVIKEVDTGTSVKKAIKIAKVIEHDKSIDESIKNIEAADNTGNGVGLNTIKIANITTLDLPKSSVDMIFTDPPYSPDYHDEYKHLSRLANKALKDGAYCCVYCGKMFLPDIMQIMGKYLEYVWTCAIHLPGNHVKINKHNLFEDWRTILIYKKSGKTASRRWVSDFIRNTKEKGLHEWQQGQDAPVQYIDAFTEPGDIVLDPFVGSGTVPLVCSKLGRRYIASDKDEKAVKIALKRLEDEGRQTKISQP